MKRNNIELVGLRFKEYGLELLDTNYLGNHYPLKCRNNNGYVGAVQYASLRGKKPYIFSEFDKRNPYAIDNIKKYILDNDLGFELLSEEMLGGNKPLLCKCGCGKEFTTTLDSIRYDNRHLCNDCTMLSRINKTRFSKEIVKKQCKDNGFTLLGNYFGALIPIQVKNENGYIGEITLANIKSGKTFSVFTPKFIIENLNHFIKLNGENLKILKIEDFSIRQDNPYLTCKCSCGEIFRIKLESLISCNKFRCNHCTGKMSKYEYEIKKFLDKNRIAYEQQKRFYEDNFQKYSFDFYIKELDLIIEVDGEGHFFPVRFNGISKKEAQLNFENTKKRDKIKNKFCKKHNINIIRIDYKNIKNGNYLEILENLTREN